MAKNGRTRICRGYSKGAECAICKKSFDNIKTLSFLNKLFKLHFKQNHPEIEENNIPKIKDEPPITLMIRRY